MQGDRGYAEIKLKQLEDDGAGGNPRAPMPVVPIGKWTGSLEEGE
jgi:hypothetical protein